MLIWHIVPHMVPIAFQASVRSHSKQLVAHRVPLERRSQGDAGGQLLQGALRLFSKYRLTFWHQMCISPSDVKGVFGGGLSFQRNIRTQQPSSSMISSKITNLKCYHQFGVGSLYGPTVTKRTSLEHNAWMRLIWVFLPTSEQNNENIEKTRTLMEPFLETIHFKP